MNLSDNKLTTLPDSFGNIQVQDNLHLSHNNFTTLPESVVNTKIGGHLYISTPQIRKFPDIIPKINSRKQYMIVGKTYW